MSRAASAGSWALRSMLATASISDCSNSSYAEGPLAAPRSTWASTSFTTAVIASASFVIVAGTSTISFVLIPDALLQEHLRAHARTSRHVGDSVPAIKLPSRCDPHPVSSRSSR